MAHDAHKKAAEHYEHAAEVYHAAAEHHAKGDHEAAHEHATKAQEHSPFGAQSLDRRLCKVSRSQVTD